MTSDSDTPKTGELIELFAPRDPCTRRALWLALRRSPRRKETIKKLRSTGKVLTYSRGLQPPPEAV